MRSRVLGYPVMSEIEFNSGRAGKGPASRDAAHPAIVALSQWSAALDGSSSEQQRRDLIAVLRGVQESNLDAGTMLEAVMNADRVWRPHAESAARRYRRNPASFMLNLNQLHDEVGEVARLFGIIYGQCTILNAAPDSAKTHSEERDRRSTALALFHLGKHAKWMITRREQANAQLWRLIHAHYALAIRQNFHDRPVILYDGDEVATTCSQLWLRTVMLATLNSGSLSPRQADRADEWLSGWCAMIGADPRYEESKHLYCVDIAGNSGPVRVSHGLNMNWPIFLRTTPLYGEITAARTRLLEDSMASSLGLYASNPLREYIDLLDQLLLMWTSTTFHVQGRTGVRKNVPSGIFAQIRQGIAEILALNDPLQIATSKMSQWTIREYSERGLGLVCPMESEPAPSPQQLIALHWQESPYWQIGVIVRVMNLHSQQARQIGVRLLSSDAILVTLVEQPWPPGAGASAVPELLRTYQAFFLVGDQRSGRVDSLLVRAGELSPSMRLTLNAEDQKFVILINRVIEGSGDWQRIGYQVLEKHARSGGERDNAGPVRLALPFRKAFEPSGNDGSPTGKNAPEVVNDAFQDIRFLSDEEMAARNQARQTKILDLAGHFDLIKTVHPRLAAAIELMWGTIECEKYMDKLILNERGAREGFSEPVMSALLALYARHINDFNFGAHDDAFSLNTLPR